MDFLQAQTHNVVTTLSVLTILAQALAATLIICLAIEFMRKRSTPVVSWCSRHGILLMFIVATTATAGSLFFSEIAGWTPCKDCWLQRIFMYPQVLLLGIALWKKDRKIALYILALSLVGMLIAADHYSDQVYAALHPVSAENPLVPCDATGVSCAKTEIHFTFGYITIPMMALSAFLLNALGAIAMMRRKNA